MESPQEGAPVGTLNQVVEAALVKIAKRLRLVESHTDVYKGLSFRALLHRSEVPQGARWVNVLASLRPTFEPHEPGFSITPLVEPDFDILEAYLPPSNLFPFLRRAVENRPLELPSNPRHPSLGTNIVRLMDSDERNTSMVEGPEYNGSAYASWKYNERWGTVSYFFGTGRPLGYFPTIQESLERLSFYSMDQVMWHHVLCPGGPTPESAQMPRSCGVHVLLPNYHARLLRVLVLGRRVQVKVEIQPGIRPETLRLVLRAYGVVDQGGHQGYAMIPPRIWSSLPTAELEHEYTMAPRSVHARLYWAQGVDESDTFVDEMRGERAETALYPELAVHAHFDPGLTVVEMALKTDRDAHDFEWAVATLLSLAGFQVDWLGYKGKAIQTKGEIDVVAYLPTKRLAILAECTLKSADVGRKVSDLAGREVDMEGILEGWRIQKVLFTTMSRAAILPTDRDGAGQLGVAILAREALPNFVRAVKSAVPPEILWERLKADTTATGTYQRLWE